MAATSERPIICSLEITFARALTTSVIVFNNANKLDNVSPAIPVSQKVTTPVSSA